MIEYILAFAFLAELDSEAPKLIAPFKTHEQCVAMAMQRNQTEEGLRDPAIRAKGGEFVCLKIVRAGA